MPVITTAEQDSLCYHKMGAGPALVLIHGFPETSDLWRAVWQVLSTRFTLIIPDLPGSGESSLTAPLSMTSMADGIRQILLHEGIDRAVIAGHSMGGYVAFAFAHAFPGMVAGMSLVHSTPAADDEAKLEARKKVIRLLQQGGKEQFIRQMVPALFSEASRKAMPAVVAERTQLALASNTESLIAYYEAMMGRADHTDKVESMQFPLQWLLGAEDTIVLKSKILQYCHGSRVNFVSVYPGCGHMAMLEVPDALSTDLAAFTAYCYQAVNTL